jgi:hypothetical protein
MANSITQLHSLSPQQLEEIVKRTVKGEVQLLQENFQPKTPIEFLTRQQTVDLLHIDLSTLWSWTKSKKLTSYSIASRVYYKRTEIENAIVEIKK